MRSYFVLSCHVLFLSRVSDFIRLWVVLFCIPQIFGFYSMGDLTCIIIGLHNFGRGEDLSCWKSF